MLTKVRVLVTGQAANQAIIDKVISTVKKIENVKAVYNKNDCWT